MKRDEESSLDAEEVVEQGPEFKHKNCSGVIDDRIWEAMILYYHVNNSFRQS